MNAQNYYYYYKGEKVNLTLDTNTSSDNKIYFKRSNSAKSIPISDIFYVKLHKSSDLSQLQQTANQKNVSIVHQNSFMSLWYKLKLNTNNNKSSLQVCNEFYETGKFADVDPAFMFNFDNSCSNDSDFGSLWGLNNTNNSNIDINICDAWSISEGNGINVAVLDQGVDKTHNDLKDNISSLSFDTQNGTSPSVFTNGRNHGTHVAGTIGAEKDNNLQIVGVAPQSEIMSISHTLSITPNISEELANGINWAWQNGAHIINNSWGDQGGQFFDQLHSALLEDAINNALNNGRNGLGTILVFASGNQSPAIDYPANSNPNIITVGAITSSSNRSNFSGFGNELDVVAPGSSILSTIPNQGTASWNGTSMAAPHVAGVAALILSVNPNLSVQDVNDIIESTAQKVGNYNYSNNSNRPNGTWNNEMGYGLVDAYAAVQMAQSYSNATLETLDYLCYNPPTTLNLSNNNNNPVTWQTSSNVSIVAQSNSAITIKASSATASGEGWVKATLSNGTVLQEEFWVGKPQFTFDIEAIGTNYLMLQMIGANGTDINNQGITTTAWEKVSNSGGCFATFEGMWFSALAHGNCNSWSIYAKITATNACGTTTVYRRITPPPPEPCRNGYAISSKGHNTFRVIDPCIYPEKKSQTNRHNNLEVKVYNHYGNLVYTTQQWEFNLSFLSRGIYIIRAHINSEVITHKFIKK